MSFALGPPPISFWYVESLGHRPCPAGVSMPTIGRVTFTAVEGAAELFTPAFCDYLTHMHDKFAPRVAAVRESREEAIHAALHDGRAPVSPSVSSTNTTPWQVPPVPDELRKPGIEITGDGIFSRASFLYAHTSPHYSGLKKILIV